MEAVARRATATAKGQTKLSRTTSVIRVEDVVGNTCTGPRLVYGRSVLEKT